MRTSSAGAARRHPKAETASCVQAKSLLVAAALALVGCGGGMSAADVVPVEVLDVDWAADDVSLRGDEVRVGGDVLVDARARELDLVDVCTKKPVGRGLWTRTRLVWWVTADDLARAMSCDSATDKGLGLAPRRLASHPIKLPPRVRAGLATGLGLAPDDVLVGVPRIDLRQEGSDTVISVEADTPDTVRLSIEHDVIGPTVLPGVAVFRVPTAVAVRAAMHGARIRLASAEVEAGARLQLYVNGQEVAPPVIEPPQEEEGQG